MIVVKQKKMIFDLFLITMVLFQTQPKSDDFPHKCTHPTFVLVRHLHLSIVCPSPTFVPVRRLYQCDVCTSPTFVSPTLLLSELCSIRRMWVRRFYQCDVCTSPTFVPVRRVYQSEVCKSDVFTVWSLLTSDVCGSGVCTSTI